jgi:thiosulfate/3-mercaptopyruvate sulfurtransferase
MKARLLAVPAFLLVALVAFTARAAEPLVDAAWVAERAAAPGIVVLDVRINGRDAFEAAHIPGAVFTDYLRDGWRVPDANGVPAMLPPVADLERLIGGLGIGNESHVVIVGHGENALEMAATTRVYWTFAVLGHEAVSILDGGMAAYAANPAHPLEAGPTMAQPATFSGMLQPALIAAKEDVAATNPAEVALVDNRPPSQYDGAQQHPRVARAGTIPGAKNAPQPWFMTESGGSFQDRAALSAIFVAQDVPLDGPLTCFCNTGHMASMGWFVAYALLGNKDAKLYDGSMIEWAADKALLVAPGN